MYDDFESNWRWSLHHSEIIEALGRFSHHFNCFAMCDEITLILGRNGLAIEAISSQQFNPTSYSCRSALLSLNIEKWNSHWFSHSLPGCIPNASFEGREQAWPLAFTIWQHARLIWWDLHPINTLNALSGQTICIWWVQVLSSWLYCPGCLKAFCTNLHLAFN